MNEASSIEAWKNSSSTESRPGCSENCKSQGEYGRYPPGNSHIPTQGTFEDEISFSQGGIC